MLRSIRRREGFGSSEGGEGWGHIVSPHAQLVYVKRTVAWNNMIMCHRVCHSGNALLSG